MHLRIANRVGCAVVLLAALTGCAIVPPADVAGPRANIPRYPVLLAEDPERREASLNALTQVIARPGAQEPELKLQPVTATIQSLPANRAVPLLLPKIGANAEMSEEETREALRRFISAWRSIIGADPSELSLVDRVNRPDGTRIARYEQRPFRYPLRGGFGQLEIQFATDRRVLEVTSTCIPQADRLQPSLTSITPVLKPEDAVKFIMDNGVNYNSPGGLQQHFRPSTPDAVNAQELVFYLKPAPPFTIEFYLAWAVALADAPVKTVYVDAVKPQVVAVE